jgi:hypothetical protein
VICHPYIMRAQTCETHHRLLLLLLLLLLHAGLI